MSHPYLEFVRGYTALLANGRQLPLGGFPNAPRPSLPPDAPKVLMFSPHPDDECIVGALPLRLLRERRVRIVNVAVTLGSNPARRSGRWEELSAACRFLGFDLRLSRPGGLEKISPKGRAESPETWAAAVETMVSILRDENPMMVVFPHEGDWNGTHIGVHYLVREALERWGPAARLLVLETEFWAPMSAPNLMIESSAEDAADLVAAISFHVGEVRRNPYHLTLPAWMQDNVRRGGELVGGQGAAAPDFGLATLYRLRRWVDGGFADALDRGRFVGVGEPLDFIKL